MDYQQKAKLHKALLAELSDGGGRVERRRYDRISVAFTNAAVREPGQREYMLGDDSEKKVLHLLTDCISPRAALVIYGGGRQPDRVLSWNDRGELKIRRG